VKTYTLLGADGLPYRTQTPGLLGGHRRTKVYGRLDCPVALSLLRRGFTPRHRVFFADEATAVAAGYRPCGACMRAEYAAWKARRAPA
jgi:methylphosphotriester-DNA--protein-cysteine methyltransferase